MMADAGRLMARDLAPDSSAAAGGGLLVGAIPPSTVEWGPTADRALLHVQRWTTDGTPPPTFARIELGTDRAIVRDGHGNARGGIRLPDVTVPVASYEGGDRPPHPVGLGGRTTAFTAEKLSALYPHHDDHVRLVAAAARAATAAGVITDARAHWYEERAAASATGAPA